MVCAVLGVLVAPVLFRLVVAVAQGVVLVLLIRRIVLRLLIVVRLVGLAVVRVGRLLRVLPPCCLPFPGLHAAASPTFTGVVQCCCMVVTWWVSLSLYEVSHT